MIVTMVILFHNMLIILRPAEAEVQRARQCRSESAVAAMQNNSWACVSFAIAQQTSFTPLLYYAFSCPAVQNRSNY